MVMPKSEFVRTEFYNDFLVPNHIQAMLNAVVLLDEGRQTVVTVQGLREFEPEHIRLHRLLAPHLQRAIQLNLKLAQWNWPIGLARGLEPVESRRHPGRYDREPYWWQTAKRNVFRKAWFRAEPRNSARWKRGRYGAAARPSGAMCRPRERGGRRRFCSPCRAGRIGRRSRSWSMPLRCQGLPAFMIDRPSVALVFVPTLIARPNRWSTQNPAPVRIDQRRSILRGRDPGWRWNPGRRGPLGDLAIDRPHASGPHLRKDGNASAGRTGPAHPPLLHGANGNEPSGRSQP